MNMHAKRIFSFLLTGLIATSAMPVFAGKGAGSNPVKKRELTDFEKYYGLELTCFTIPAAVVFYLMHKSADIEQVKKDLERARIIKATWELNPHYPFTFEEVRNAFAIADKSEEELSQERTDRAMPAALITGAGMALLCFVIRHSDSTHVGLHTNIGSGFARAASSSFRA